MKWWSRWVTLPHEPACRAGALLVCHDPMNLAGRLGAAPSKLSFGDSVAHAGARPVDNGMACRTEARVRGVIESACAALRQPSPAPPSRAKDGAVAGNRPRTCSLAGSHSPVKSQPRKLRGPGASALPAHAISTKNKHLLVIFRSQPADSRRLFRCFPSTRACALAQGEPRACREGLGAHLLRSP
jgi:hypothetical protein